MLRSVLMGVLAFSAASACKGAADAPAVQPGVAVGKVVEASGDVSATRGADKRALATGQDISGDDVIETGAGATVRIRFAHNNATWELGPNKKQLVSTSLAWKAPKANTPAGEVNEATLAAGRHAERETVTTGTTAPSEAPAAAAPAAAAPAPVGGVPDVARAPVDDGDMMAKGGGGGTDDRKVAPRAAKQQKESARGGEVEGGKNVADKDATQEVDRKMASRRADDAVSSPPPPPPSPVTSPGAPAPDPAPSSDELVQDMVGDVRIAMGKYRLALVKCLTNKESAANTLSIPIVVTGGKARFVFGLASKVTDKQKACLAEVAAKLSFPASYDVKTKYDLTY